MNKDLEKELCKILEVENLDPRYVAVDFSDCDFEDVKETHSFWQKFSDGSVLFSDPKRMDAYYFDKEERQMYFVYNYDENDNEDFDDDDDFYGMEELDPEEDYPDGWS